MSGLRLVADRLLSPTSAPIGDRSFLDSVRTVDDRPSIGATFRATPRIFASLATEVGAERPQLVALDAVPRPVGPRVDVNPPLTADAIAFLLEVGGTNETPASA